MRPRIPEHAFQRAGNVRKPQPGYVDIVPPAHTAAPTWLPTFLATTILGPGLVQRAINRVQPFELVESVYSRVRGAGFESINLDLICGLPRQTPSTFSATLKHVIELRPDRLALYGYAHMPSRFKVQRRIIASELPNGAERIALLQLAMKTLTVVGYVYIGMAHFPQMDCLSRSGPAPCIALFRGIPPTPIATWWRSASVRSAILANSTFRISRR